MESIGKPPNIQKPKALKHYSNISSQEDLLSSETETRISNVNAWADPSPKKPDTLSSSPPASDEPGRRERRSQSKARSSTSTLEARIFTHPLPAKKDSSPTIENPAP